MPAVAVITIIGAILTVLVLAAYLIRVARILQRVKAKLGDVIVGVESAAQKTEPLGSILREINKDLAGADKGLQDVLTKQR